MDASLTFTPIALMLFFAFLGGFVLHRLRQPTLVGYILVGALVGHALIGTHAPAVRLLADLAIVLLMFMLGLELDIARFKRSMKPALLVTGLQILLSLCIMMLTAFLFHWAWQLGMLLGFVIALSSTAVAVSMLESLKETNSATGRLAIAILVAQDLAVVPILLIISALGGVFATGEVLHFGFAVGVIFLSLFGIFELHQHPHWIARIERLLTTGKSQPVVAGLALAFGAAALSGALGLSNAYGAFAIGLLIGNIGEIGASYRKAVHSIHDLLMMTFFLSVGILLDVSFVFKHWFEIVVIVAITLLLKTAVNAGILHFLIHIPKRSALMLGAVLGQVGEFSFVLIALGLSNGFITNEQYQFVLAIIALSLACSPILLQCVRLYIRERTS